VHTKVGALVGLIMHVIVVASRKGGAGKTCLSRHLSVQAGLSRHGPVGVIDTDPAGGLASWYEDRLQAGRNQPMWRDAQNDLRSALQAAEADGIQLLFIDTPPAISATIADVISVADLVVIPVRPSADDLRQIGATLDLVDAAGCPLVFVINQAAVRTRLTHETSSALSQHGTVAPAVVHFRQEYAASSSQGLTAVETEPEGRAASEIAELWTYLYVRLTKESARVAA